MKRPDRVIECGVSSQGNTPRDVFTFRRVQSICSVHQNLLETFREQSIRIQLSYSRYKRQVIASGNGLVKCNSILILPLSICDVRPADAPWSGVR